MLKRDSSLANLENATGITPLEIAENKLITYLLQTLNTTILKINHENYRSGTKFKPSAFSTFNSIDDESTILWKKCSQSKIMQLLRNASAKSDKKRILISLQDANELVRCGGDAEEGDRDRAGNSNNMMTDKVKTWMSILDKRSFE
ncbi:hypothetical protein ACO22_06971 [Paracoccidioides brasiliensis]|uniref:Uncharacterized protein n=1 Tax=Paracoccidioides brasiliensis TaxID=121759 RepID=A0A1D2J603_PARBR|nr:hypothetical protein ACO22_06971 [Paracoccidioides brasiliensis]